MNPITQETFALMKQALGTPNDAIAKAISTGTGLVAYDLQAPAKNLYPFITPLRNVIPRVGGGTGTATNWRQVNAIIGSGFDAMGWVPEGQRSGQMSYNTSNKSATYVTIGEEDAATYEAISAGVHFEDIQARMTFRLLQKMMLKEEMAILAGNAGASTAAISLGTPGTVSVSAIANTASTLTTATYYVQVVALTLEGYPELGRHALEHGRRHRQCRGDRGLGGRHAEERHRRRRQGLHALGRLLEHQRALLGPGRHLGHQHARGLGRGGLGGGRLCLVRRHDQCGRQRHPAGDHARSTRSRSRPRSSPGPNRRLRSPRTAATMRATPTTAS